MANAPSMFYFRGDVSLMKCKRRVAVVGSHRASPEGIGRARALAKALAQRGIVVVSGLAAGIDTAAHRAAMEAGGKTIAVLGTSLDHVYPPYNKLLQQRIGSEHLLVSQFPIGKRRFSPQNFPLRNRTLALVTQATLIVEAGEDSGTLDAGWEALRLGRPLFLLESSAADPALTWPAKMIAQGARVLSIENLDERLATLYNPPPTDRSGSSAG